MNHCRCKAVPVNKKQRLISNWKNSWRLSSVQLTAALVLLNAVNAEILPLFSFTIPASIMNWLNAILGVSIIVLRLMLQPKLIARPDAPERPDYD